MQASPRENWIFDLQTKPAWYSAYYAAMLECDENRALHLIESAEVEVQDRIAELGLVGPVDKRELLDIDNALNHLQILLRSWHGQDRRKLWQQ
jgi:hypothetical protein